MKTLAEFGQRLLFVGAVRQVGVAQTQGVGFFEKSERASSICLYSFESLIS